MRLTKFHELMSDEFGQAYASVLLRDLALIDFHDLTGEQALANGEDPREVWHAICRAQQVPKERWQGVTKISKK